MSGLTTVGYFLFSLFFSVVTFMLWARFALRFFRVSSLHPTSQAINTFTNPIVKPLDGLFKAGKNRMYRYDWACFSALVIAELLKFICMDLLVFGNVGSLILLVSYTIADLIIQPCNLLFYAIIIRVIMSWVNPRWKSSFSDLIYLVTEPLICFTRRFTPTIAQIDLAPFFAIIMLQVITLFIGASLPSSLV